MLGIKLYMGYNVTSSLIGWTHAQNDPCNVVLDSTETVKEATLYTPNCIPDGRKILLVGL